MKQHRKTHIKYNCEVCNVECTKTERAIKKYNHHFCGRKCSLAYLKISGKQRKPEGNCYKCKKPILSSRKYCYDCSNMKRILPPNNRTIRGKTKTGLACSLYKCSDCETLVSHKEGRCKSCYQKLIEETNQKLLIKDCLYSNDANKHNFIRQHASKVIKALEVERKCCNCGYSKFTEICHIRSIKSFPLDATLNDVNNINNLIILCPNCHAEFDKLPESRKEILEKLNARVLPPI